MNYKIRKAELNDVSKLDELLTKLIHFEKNFDDNIDADFIVDNFYINLIGDTEKCFLVAESENNIVGYLYGYIIDNGIVCINNGAKIDALFVLEEYRNLGIAKKLIQAFKFWAINRKATYIEVDVFNKNLQAYNLYENVGFKANKTTMNIEIK